MPEPLNPARRFTLKTDEMRGDDTLARWMLIAHSGLAAHKECACGHDGLETAVEVTKSIACHTERRKAADRRSCLNN
jgi:hypothetical protein